MDAAANRSDANGRPRLTDQQRLALQTRDVSVALSAGAGCGKTFVLTERFLRALEPASERQRTTSRWGQIVAITFTERAAREMRDRIRRGCHQRLAIATADEAAAWTELLREVDAARISTIHSFCGALLRAHAVEAGLDPHFVVLDQTQSATLLSEAVDDVLRRLLAGRDRRVLDLAVAFDLRGLRGRIMDLLSERTKIDFAAWRDTTPQQVVENWLAFLRDVVAPAAARRVAHSADAVTVRQILEENEPSHATMQERRALLLDLLPRLADSTRPQDDLAEVLSHARVQGGGTKKAWPSEEVYTQFKDAAASLRDLVKQQLNRLNLESESAAEAARLGLDLLGIAHDVAQHYEQRKRELDSLDFDDLLIRARDLLAHPDHGPLRAQVASQIHLVLVDEFQDTDRVQVELVEAVCGDALEHGKLLFVGDFKQSIYRFRGAEPEVFQQLRRRIPPAGRLPLTRNFRSQPAILHFVNALFCDVFQPDYEPLEPHREQLTPEPAVEFLWAPSDADEKEPAEVRRQREAEWIARRLRQLLDSREPLIVDTDGDAEGASALRPLELGDIAILFRALSNVELYEAALRRYGIDYYLVGGHAFYTQQEVFDLLNLLRALASPADEVSLLGVLRSPFFSLADETLFWLAQHPGGLAGGLFARQQPDVHDAEQSQRAQSAAKTLRALRNLKDRVPIASLIQEALALTGYDAVLLSEFLGERKLANLRKLIDQARGFDRNVALTLADFIGQLADFVADQPKEALAATQAESANVVRLMTIHQAKGLEFPLVVVPDVDRPRNASHSAAAFDPRLGPLVKAPQREGSSAAGHDLYTIIEEEADEAELLRLFYVVTTRARDCLILSGGVQEIGSTHSPWTRLLAERFDLATGEFLASLPPGYVKPQVKVTTEQPLAEQGRGARRRSVSFNKLQPAAERSAASGSARIPAEVAAVPADLSARRQYSFSRLSGALHAVAPPVVLDQESGAKPSSIDPRSLGTLVHEVLAEIPFGQPVDVPALVERLAPQQAVAGASHAEQSDEIGEATRLVEAFLNSPRAGELARAAGRFAELEFLLAWPPDDPVDGGRYLQGFIDCLYQDAAGHWHIVDFKTNQVSKKSLAAVAAPYELQLLVYSLAVEHHSGTPPASATLHFLRGGLEYAFSPSAKSRQQLIDEVTRRMETAQAAPDLAGV